MSFDEIYSRSISDPEGFWSDAANDVFWYKKPPRALDRTAGVYGRWFAGGQTNSCYNALDLHIENGHGDQAAPRDDLETGPAGRRLAVPARRNRGDLLCHCAPLRSDIRI